MMLDVPQNYEASPDPCSKADAADVDPGPRNGQIAGCVVSICHVVQLRERDWANVVTAHEGDLSAYTWRLSHLALGEHVLRPPSKKLKVCACIPAHHLLCKLK